MTVIPGLIFHGLFDLYSQINANRVPGPETLYKEPHLAEKFSY